MYPKNIALQIARSQMAAVPKTKEQLLESLASLDKYMNRPSVDYTWARYEKQHLEMCLFVLENENVLPLRKKE